VDSRIIKNYIAPSTVEQLGMPYRQKLKPYALAIISGEPVLYKDGIINLETRLV
jgi:hypothetical protein